jgi:hypothetical protein
MTEPVCEVCGEGESYQLHGVLSRDPLCHAFQPEPKHSDAEVVICAAVVADNGEVVRCHRHHDGLRAIADRDLAHAEREDAQGFITSRNRYVDRREAMRIQRAAGIESVAPGGYRGTQLFSEDLY